MKKVHFCSILFILFSISFVRAQDRVHASINPEDPAFREKFSTLDFDKKFYLLAVTDEVNYYYMADFTQMPDKFERVYFINLVYQSDKIVNIDHDLSQSRVWFLVNKKYSKKEVGEEFDLLKDKTITASSTMTKEEKNAWMMKNEKFK
jgi:hypothetical protein